MGGIRPTETAYQTGLGVLNKHKCPRRSSDRRGHRRCRARHPDPHRLQGALISALLITQSMTDLWDFKREHWGNGCDLTSDTGETALPPIHPAQESSAPGPAGVEVRPCHPGGPAATLAVRSVHTDQPSGTRRQATGGTTNPEQRTTLPFLYVRRCHLYPRPREGMRCPMRMAGAPRRSRKAAPGAPGLALGSEPPERRAPAPDGSGEVGWTEPRLASSEREKPEQFSSGHGYYRDGEM